MNKKFLFYSTGIVSISLAMVAVFLGDKSENPQMLCYVVSYAFSIMGIAVADFLARKGLSRKRHISQSELIWSKIIFGLWISLLPSIGFIFILSTSCLINKRLFSLLIGFIYAVIFIVYTTIGKGWWYFEKEE